MRPGPGGRRGAGAGLHHRINLFGARRRGRDTLQMVSFNHGVSSLTQEDPALKYHLCARLCRPAQAPGPRRGRSRSLPPGRGVEGRFLEGNTRLSHPPAASPPTTGTFPGRRLQAARRETGQPEAWNPPPAGEGGEGRRWLNPPEPAGTRCPQPGARGEHPVTGHLNPHSKPVVQILAPKVKARKRRLTPSDQAKRSHNTEVQGCSTVNTRPWH